MKSCALTYSNGKAFLFFILNLNSLLWQFVSPLKYSHIYSEKLVHLPYCYFVNDYKQVCIVSYHIYEGKVTLKMPHKIKVMLEYQTVMLHRKQLNWIKFALIVLYIHNVDCFDIEKSRSSWSSLPTQTSRLWPAGGQIYFCML